MGDSWWACRQQWSRCCGMSGWSFCTCENRLASPGIGFGTWFSCWCSQWTDRLVYGCDWSACGQQSRVSLVWSQESGWLTDCGEESELCTELSMKGSKQSRWLCQQRECKQPAWWVPDVGERQMTRLTNGWSANSLLSQQTCQSCLSPVQIEQI